MKLSSLLAILIPLEPGLVLNNSFLLGKWLPSSLFCCSVKWCLGIRGSRRRCLRWQACAPLGGGYFCCCGHPHRSPSPQGTVETAWQGLDPPSISTGERALAGERDGAWHGPRGHAHRCSDGHQEEQALPGVTALACMHVCRYFFFFPTYSCVVEFLFHSKHHFLN